MRNKKRDNLIKKLKKSGKVVISLSADPDHMPIRGNFDSGDKVADEKLEDELIKRSENGDVWAWAEVTVRAILITPHPMENIIGEDHLGGCSYESEADFRKDGYYDDMVNEALGKIADQLLGAAEIIKSL